MIQFTNINLYYQHQWYWNTVLRSLIFSYTIRIPYSRNWWLYVLFNIVLLNTISCTLFPSLGVASNLLVPYLCPSDGSASAYGRSKHVIFFKVIGRLLLLLTFYRFILEATNIVFLLNCLMKKLNVWFDDKCRVVNKDLCDFSESSPVDVSSNTHLPDWMQSIKKNRTFL